MEYILVPLGLVLAIMLARPFFIAIGEQYDKDLAAHKDNLRKGGLMPRVDNDLHKEALRQLCEESPNLKLPRRTIV